MITRDVPTAATDGKRIFINPDYFCPLKVSEQVFILAHEMSHFVCRHPARFKHYAKQGELRGKPWIQTWANVCADYVINADIVASMPNATINPGWLFDPSIKGDELWEDVYERTLKVIPPPPPGQGKGKPKSGPCRPAGIGGHGGCGQRPPIAR